MKKQQSLNHFLIAVLIISSLSLSACGGKTGVMEQQLTSPMPLTPIIEEPKVEEQVVEATPSQDNQPQESYEVIENNQQAQEMAKEIEEKVEEIEVKDRIFFGYDSAEVSNEGKEVLNTQAEWLNAEESINIIIEGHCDERGTREYNIALGEKRANAAKDYLVSKGVKSNRIKVVSYGKERPVAFGSDESSLSKNRRSVTVIQ